MHMRHTSVMPMLNITLAHDASRLGNYNMQRLYVLVFSLAVLTCVGCSKGDGKLALQGKVTFDGEPISSGEITFKPSEASERPVMGTIMDGSYQIAEEFGATPGDYTVSITATRPTKSKERNPYAPDAIPTEQYIPRQFNVATTLKVGITADSNSHDFALVSQP